MEQIQEIFQIWSEKLPDLSNLELIWPTLEPNLPSLGLAPELIERDANCDIQRIIEGEECFARKIERRLSSYDKILFSSEHNITEEIV